MTIQYKAVGARSLATDEGKGIVTALVSVTGIVDNVKDIIEPGAYAKSLGIRKPKGVWHHSWEKAVAKTLEIKELLPGDPMLPKTLPDGTPWPVEAGALFVKMQFNLNTQRGRDAYEDVKFFGADQQWSIGYNVPAGAATVKNGVRRIKSLDLYEYSPVLHGAMPSALTLSVKSAQEAWRHGVEEKGIEHAEEFFADVKSFLGDTEYKGIKIVEEDPEPDTRVESPDQFEGEVYVEDYESNEADWTTDEEEDEVDRPKKGEKAFLSAAQAADVEIAIKALSALLQKSDEALIDQGDDVSEPETKSLADLCDEFDFGDDLMQKAEQFDDAAQFSMVKEMGVAATPILDAVESAVEQGDEELKEIAAFIASKMAEVVADVEEEDEDDLANSEPPVEDEEEEDESGEKSILDLLELKSFLGQ